MPTNRIRVALCDDHELVRRGLRGLLESDLTITVVGEAATADEALALVDGSPPDIVIMDVRMPGRSGIEACRDIRAAHPEVHVLILTSFADEEALFGAIIAGASGYILKQVRGNELLDAVHQVANGRSLLDPAAAERVLARIRGDAPLGAEGEKLTAREDQVLSLVAEGMSNRQVGERLGLAEKTVKNYVSSILMKLGLVRRTEAVALVAKRRQRRDSSESW